MTGRSAARKTGPASPFRSGIRWIVEEKGVRVFRAATGELFVLGYPEAAVWDLLGRGRAEAKIAAELAAIMNWSASKARASVRVCLDRWSALGILRAARSRG